MFRNQVINLFFIAQISISLGFLCFQNSSYVNKQVDFDKIAALKWKFLAGVETLRSQKYYPFNFNFDMPAKVKLSTDKINTKETQIQSLMIDFQCEDSFSVFIVTKVENLISKEFQMEYRYCSKKGYLLWPQFFIYLIESAKVLILYFCNEEMEVMMILTLNEVLVKDVMEDALKEIQNVLKLHYSNLLDGQNSIFNTTNNEINPINCKYETRSCEKYPVSYFNSLKIGRSDSETLTFSLIPLLVLGSFLVAFAVIKTIVEVVKVIKKRLRRNNAVHPVVFYIN